MALGNSVTESSSSEFNGKVGIKLGISSADKPSILSTTDLGRNFLPCKLLRLMDKCGVA